MRIASTQFQAQVVSAMQAASGHLADLNAQMASGKRLQLISDDPLTAVRLARLNDEEASIAQYRDNIGALKSRLQLNEGSLSGMSSDLQQAHDLLLAAANGSSSSADLQAAATPLQGLRDSLFYAANTKDGEGRYLFSGTATATPAITFDASAPPGSRYSFSGNTEVQRVVVGSGVTQPANTSVPELAALLNRLDSATDVLQAPGADINDPATRSVVTAALDGTDSAMSQISAKVAALGSTQNGLATQDTNHANVSLSNQQALIDLGDLDYGAAALQLNSYTMALQATQKAYAKVNGLSLFNVL